MSENDFMKSLKEEMPDDFGRDLLGQLKAEEKSKIKPMPAAIWTVAAACFVTVLVGFVLLISRVPNGTPLSVAEQGIWQVREPITPENINLVQPLLTVGYGHAEAIALSPDNNTLAVATSIGVYLHDAHNLDLPPRFLGVPEGITVGTPFINRFTHIEYSDDGRLFVFVNSLDKMSLYQWDEASQSYLSLFTHSQGSNIIPQVVDISPDGTKLLLGACSNSGGTFGSFCPKFSLGRIQITELATGESLFFRSTRKVSNAIVAMNPDWTKMAYQEEDQIRLYDLQTEETVTLLTIEAVDDELNMVAWNELHSLYFSPDGTKIGVYDGFAPSMDWWEISELEEYALHVPAFGVDSDTLQNRRPAAGINPLTGEYIIGSTSGLFVYEMFETRPRYQMDSAVSPISYQISSDAEKLYALDDTGLIRVWDLQSHEQIATSLRYGIGADHDFSISDDSQVFIRGNNSYYSGLGFLFELAPSGLLQTPISSGENGYLSTTHNAISSDARYVAFTEQSELWVYDRHENRSFLLDSYVYYPELAFRPDGSLLAFSRFDNVLSAQMYSAEMLDSGEIPARNDIAALADLPITFFELSPDGTKLIVYYCVTNPTATYESCSNMSLRVFDTYTWEELGALGSGLTEAGLYTGFNASTDSNWLLFAYCSEKADVEWGCKPNSYVLEIWNLEALSEETEPVLRLDGLTEELWASTSIRPYADGSFLVTTLSYDYDMASYQYMPYVIFWHVQANGEYEEVQRIQSYGITMSPDGSYFLTARNGQIELWGIPANVASSD